MKIRPLGDRVIVKRVETEEKSDGGIILTGSVFKNLSRGTVVAVGPGRTLDDGKVVPVAVKEGDTVVFNEGYTMKKEKLDGEDVLILSENDILAVVEDRLIEV